MQAVNGRRVVVARRRSKDVSQCQRRSQRFTYYSRIFDIFLFLDSSSVVAVNVPPLDFEAISPGKTILQAEPTVLIPAL
jgi:hypothetical protein